MGTENWELGALNQATKQKKEEILNDKLIELANCNQSLTEKSDEVRRLTGQLNETQEAKAKIAGKYSDLLGNLARLGYVDFTKVYIIKGKALQFFKNRYGSLEMKVYDVVELK